MSIADLQRVESTSSTVLFAIYPRRLAKILANEPFRYRQRRRLSVRVAYGQSIKFTSLREHTDERTKEHDRLTERLFGTRRALLQVVIGRDPQTLQHTYETGGARFSIAWKRSAAGDRQKIERFKAAGSHFLRTFPCSQHANRQLLTAERTHRTSCSAYIPAQTARDAQCQPKRERT